MAEKNSKELLRLEADGPAIASTPSLESKLFVCHKDSRFPLSGAPLQKPTMFPVPKSHVMGKVHDFLSVISESNKKLLNDAKDNPESYDIEVLDGKGSEYIEMCAAVVSEANGSCQHHQDLMLGVADLHTPEAVAAAEIAMAGRAPSIPLAESGWESEDSRDEDDHKNKDKINKQIYDADTQSAAIESKNAERDSSCKPLRKQKLKKRTKIVELS
ncbi:hypothetical protein OROMI_020142 [Orobanche minor]